MKITLADLITKIELILEKLELAEGNKKSKTAVPAAVLIPIFEKNAEPHILLTKRTETVRHHKGQISFPGGVAETSDADLSATALRETSEEVGILSDDVKILGRINSMITITNFHVTPYIGIFPYPYEFKTNQDEIHELIEVPLSHLLKKENLRVEQRELAGEFYTVHYFTYQEHLIWGVTGKILHDFLELLQK